MHGASRLTLPRLPRTCRSRSSGRFGLRGGGCRALSEDFIGFIGFRVEGFWVLGLRGLGFRACCHVV